MGIFTVSPTSEVSSVRGSHKCHDAVVPRLPFGKVGIDSCPVGCDENFADLHFYFEAVEIFFVGVV